MHSIVIKNDAVCDLVYSLKEINNIISSSKKVTIFLSKLSEKYSFLVNNPKVEIKILNYDLNIIEKIKLIFFLTKNDINNVYILAPKNFYYYLPIVFRIIKFYAICINNINNYRRPNLFLRKFLFKYKINDREKIFKRDSIKLIQDKLTSVDNINFDYELTINVKKKDIVSPGHVFPIISKEGGVLVRAGHTDATVDISKFESNKIFNQRLSKNHQVISEQIEFINSCLANDFHNNQVFICSLNYAKQKYSVLFDRYFDKLAKHSNSILAKQNSNLIHAFIRAYELTNKEKPSL